MRPKNLVAIEATWRILGRQNGNSSDNGAMKKLTCRIGKTLLLLSLCISAPSLFGETITFGSIYMGNPQRGFIPDFWGPAECFYCSSLSVAAIQGNGDFGAGAGTVGATT